MLQAEGVDYLAVALPIEGVELRSRGISLPILVLTAGTDFFPEIIDNRLEPGIPNISTLAAFCSELASRGITGYPVHIKLDTGMHRLGFMTSELEELTVFLRDHKEVSVKSIYSHLAAAGNWVINLCGTYLTRPESKDFRNISMIWCGSGLAFTESARCRRCI